MGWAGNFQLIGFIDSHGRIRARAVGIGGDDIAPAIAVVPFRHRKLEEIHVVDAEDVFQDRAALDDP